MDARRLAGAGAVTAATVLAALAPAAQGRTLGTVERPLDATEVDCLGWDRLVGWQVAETRESWTVPVRGVLASWSTNVTEGAPGQSVTLVVLRGAVPALTIAAVDRATFPSPLPAAGVATFSPATPIVLEAGDRLGIAGSSGATCGWRGGAIPAGQRAQVGDAAPGIAPGAIVTESIEESSARLNLAAEVLEQTDLRVTASAGPADLVVGGGLGQLSATVSNAGPAPTPVTVTDTVPAGLTVVTAVAGGGSCTIAGQKVTCTIPSLAAGTAAPVVVLVSPTAPGSYANTITADPALEAVPGDNSANATLTAVAPRRDSVILPEPRPPRCVVPRLTRTPLAVARDVLGQLRCRTGKITKQRSAKVPKGTVISTKPGHGRYRAGSSVRLVVSSGKPPRRAARRAKGRR